MSLNLNTPITAFDGRFVAPSSNEVSLYAREGMIAEFNFRNFSSSTVCPNLITGSGVSDVTYASAPTVSSSTGVALDGTHIGTFTTPTLNDNYSVFIAARNIADGYNCFGSFNTTDGVGTGLRVQSGMMTLMTGKVSNYCNIGTPTAGVWHGWISRIVNKQGRGRNITSRVYAVTPVRWNLDTRTNWKVGACAQTTGANHDVDWFPSATGNIVYAALWNKVLTTQQEQAWLTTVSALLATSSITLS